jgi:NADH-quinone oxidoreductase subunit E
MLVEKEKIQLSKSVCDKIDAWMKRYPANQKQSAVMSALHFAQEENNNFLSEPLMEAVADYLGMPHIAVFEVASFYTLYNLEPVGRHTISVCTNISCMLANSHEIVDHLKQKLQINVNETTADGKFTLREVECLAACAAAPMFQIGRNYHVNLTPAKVDSILEELE